MKKRNLSFAILFVLFSFFAIGQQDTIIGFDFSDNAGAFKANFGLSGNSNYNLRAEDTADFVRPLEYTAAGSDYAATAIGWDEGKDKKFWSIKFKADGFTNMKVYSKQLSTETDAGPKSWKVQARKSGEDWTDVVDGDVTVANDWTTGVVNGLNLPASLDLPGTTSVGIRWIMTSNDAITDEPVTETGISKIDDIFVTGLNSAGIETIIFENNVAIYPNPCNDILYVESMEEMTQINIYGITGSLIIRDNISRMDTQYDLSNFNPGIYFVTIQFKNESGITKRKVVVE